MTRQFTARRVNENEIRLASVDGPEQFVWQPRAGETWEQGRTYTFAVALDEATDDGNTTQQQDTTGDTGDQTEGGGQA